MRRILSLVLVAACTGVLPGCLTSAVYDDLVAHGGTTSDSWITPLPVRVVEARATHGPDGASIVDATLAFESGATESFAPVSSFTRDLDPVPEALIRGRTGETCAVVDSARLVGTRDDGYELRVPLTHEELRSAVRPIVVLDGHELLLFPVGQRHALEDGTIVLGCPTVIRLDLRQQVSEPSSDFVSSGPVRFAVFAIAAPVLGTIDLLLSPAKLYFMLTWHGC